MALKKFNERYSRYLEKCDKILGELKKDIENASSDGEYERLCRKLEIEKFRIDEEDEVWDERREKLEKFLKKQEEYKEKRKEYAKQYREKYKEQRKEYRKKFMAKLKENQKNKQ